MTAHIITGDCLDVLATLPAGSHQCIVTSPPYYGLRDYGVAGQIGLEPTPDEYVARMVAVFRECRRVLRDDGTLFLNVGDSYNAGTAAPSKPSKNETDVGYWQNADKIGRPRTLFPGIKTKDLCGIPWLLAFALRADGWYLRSEIIWHKPNPMPESVRDRPTKAHETVFLLTKQARYFYDAEAISEEGVVPAGTLAAKGSAERFAQAGVNSRPPEYKEYDGRRNARSVWTIATQPFSGSRLLADYVGADGKPYKLSPDCPVHGRRGNHQSPQTGECDAPLDYSRYGNLGIDPGRAEELEAERGARLSMPSDRQCAESPLAHETQSTHESKTPDQSPTHFFDDQANGDEFLPRTDGTPECATLPDDTSGLPLPCSSEPAISNSSQSHRTAPVPATIPPCIASAQTAIGTDDRSALPDLFGSAAHIGGNKTDGSEMGERPSGQTEKRSVRKSAFRHHTGLKCLCEQVSTDHFATMPPDLAERCILAGTSARGQCPHCGSPWARVVERVDTGRTQKAADGWDVGPGGHGTIHREGRSKGAAGAPVLASVTTGWAPSCECPPHDPVPQKVLDPFGGAGTTGLVAHRLQRGATLIELNPDYAAMARERIRADAPLFV